MSFQNKTLREKLEYLLLFTTAGVSLLIAILDLSGLLDASPWIAGRVPALTLLAVGFVASYLIWERRGTIDKIERNLEEGTTTIINKLETSAQQIISALDGVSVTRFKSGTEMNLYAAARFKRARRIDDVTWGNSQPQRQSRPRPQQDIDSFRLYGEAVDDFIKDPANVWREVAVFHKPEHFQREQVRVFESANVAYSLRHYPIPTEIAPNLQGFTVVDQEEVLISHSRSSTWLSIKHPGVVAYYIGYFDDLWFGAEFLKEGSHIGRQQLDALAAKFNIKIEGDNGL